MSFNTLASMALRISQASRTSPTDDGDLNKLISLTTEASRSKPFTRCLLRQPDNDTAHKQIAHFQSLAALEEDDICVFIAHDTALHNLETVLAVLLIHHVKTIAPFPTGELPDFINEDVYRYVQREAEAQRRTVMKRDHYAVVVIDVYPTHPKRDQIRKTLYAFAVAEIRKKDPQSDIVAQVFLDSRYFQQIFPEAEGWEKVEEVVVLDSAMLPTVEEKLRSLRMYVNWGRNSASGHEPSALPFGFTPINRPKIS